MHDKDAKHEAMRLVMGGASYRDAAERAGVSARTLTNMPEYKEWRVKKREESPPKKPHKTQSKLTRIGEAGKNKHNRMVGIYQCECGKVKEIMDHNVTGPYATTVSCGCHTTTGAYKEAVRDGLKASWKSGGRKHLSEEAKEKVSKAVIATMKLRRGIPKPPGLSEAGPDNWAAKYWHLISPGKIAMKGLNLNHLIRTNSHLFDPSDLVWKKSMCRASKALRNLLEPPKPGHSGFRSWKGWVIGDTMKREEAPSDS